MQVMKKLDPYICIPTALLLLFGLMMLFSTTFFKEPSFFYRQAVWIALSSVMFVIIQYIPMKIFFISSYLLYAVNILLLIFVRLFNASYIERWIDIGFAYIQPSEFMKVTAVFAMARFLTARNKDATDPKIILFSSLFILAPFILVFVQPDLGTSTLFIIGGLSMLYLSGVPVSYIIILVSPLLSIILSFVPIAWILYIFAAGFLFYSFRISILNVIRFVFMNIAVGAAAPFIWGMLKEYQKFRLLSYLNPQKDIHGYGWNLLQSKIAIGSGGFWGKGFLKGTQKGLEFIPQQHTDFIFSVIGEETGFLGFLFLAAMLFIITSRMVYIYPSVRSRYSKYISAVFLCMILAQIFLNISMTLGIIPIVGVPLNFISYGGSSIMTTVVMAAIMNKVAKERLEYW